MDAEKIRTLRITDYASILADQAASGPFLSVACDEGACECCVDENCACPCHRPDERDEEFLSEEER